MVEHHIQDGCAAIADDVRFNGQDGHLVHRPVLECGSLPWPRLIYGAEMTAEVGVDMSRFPTPAHPASWGPVPPGVKESAGRKKGNGHRAGDRYLASTPSATRSHSNPPPNQSSGPLTFYLPAGAQTAVNPPSTATAEPVMKLAKSLARNTARFATSAGWPSRLTRCALANSAATSSTVLPGTSP